MGGACRVRQGRHQGPVTVGLCARHWQIKEENTQLFPERGGGCTFAGVPDCIGKDRQGLKSIEKIGGYVNIPRH